LTGSPDRPRQFFYFKKNQNDVVLVKKKSTDYNRVFDRVAGSHQVFSFTVFSSTWLDSSPGSARQAGPGFKTMVLTMRYFILFYLIPIN
jgi:hypothetical protein